MTHDRRNNIANNTGQIDGSGHENCAGQGMWVCMYNYSNGDVVRHDYQTPSVGAHSCRSIIFGMVICLRRLAPPLSSQAGLGMGGVGEQRLLSLPREVLELARFVFRLEGSRGS